MSGGPAPRREDGREDGPGGGVAAVRGSDPRRAVYRFDRFTLDLVRGALLSAGGTEVALRPKAFALLARMVESAGRLLDRDEIMRAVWPGVIVTDDSITQCVREIRRALGDDDQQLVRTVPRRGFLFAAEVSRADATTAAVSPPGAPAAAPPPPAAAAPAASPAAATAAGPPTLVVLPFADLTGDPAQAHLADGLTEDLTGALGRLGWFAVVAGSSAAAYRGRGADLREVGRALGAGYALEGSVRRAGGRVRVAARLCEAEGGRQIWAERIDGDLADAFDLQDRVVEAVCGAAEPALRRAEAERTSARPAEGLSAYELTARARPQRSVTAREVNDEALKLLRRSLALDPGLPAARGALAALVAVRVSHGWAEPGDAEEAVRHARAVAEGGDNGDANTLAWAAYALSFLAKDTAVGLAAADRALRMAPNSAVVLVHSGWCRLYAGDWRAAVEQVERAARLSPDDPQFFQFTLVLGSAYFVGERWAEAAEAARRTLRDRPGFVTARRMAAASLALLGRVDEAREAVRELLAVAPGDTVSAVAAHTGVPSPVRERYLDALRLAGLPE